MMSGWGVGCSGENVLYNGVRHRVRFEATDRTASPQKILQVNCVRQSELV
jgi:hypothetical protein